MPDLTDTTLFPTFLTIPELEQDPDAPSPQASAPPGGGQGRWYLLAQVRDDMTINKPTLVLSDRDGHPFALVFEGLGRDDLDLRGLGLRKGSTAVIPMARRTTPAGGASKRSFVRVARGDAGGVRAVPGPLARVLELAGQVRGGVCETCAGSGEGGLRRCAGCGKSAYCSKVSSAASCVLWGFCARG